MTPPPVSTPKANGVSVTLSKLGNRNTFTKQPDFCFLLDKLRKKCGSKWKRSGLDHQYPELCTLLRGIEEVVR